LHLYSGTSVDFVADATRNRIAAKVEESFERHFRYKPPQSEVRSWQSSLRAMADVCQLGALEDHGVVVELQLPLSSRRLDCMITGHDYARNSQAVIVELKQWEAAAPSWIDDCVVAFVGGRERDVLHPSRQVGNYERYLLDVHTSFSAGDVKLHSCSYLHNLRYDARSELFEAKHTDLLQQYPLFAGDQVDDLVGYLNANLGEGDGVPVLEEVLRGRYRPHKRLLDHVAAMVATEPIFVLLDDQQVAFSAVLAKVRARHLAADPSVMLIRGGPGTGKSVIAVNLVGELARQGYVVHHATGSKAFTENLRKRVGKRAGALFNYFNSFDEAEQQELDVLVCDEAHRLREHSWNRFTAKAKRSNQPQVEELMKAAKVSVFFIDDLQIVRPGEVGSSELIRGAASKLGASVDEFALETQFRCGGSERYVRWVENTLGLARTPDVMWDPDEEFDFDVVDSPQELEGLIRQRNAEGFTARLSAGFCWPWSNPNPDGTLVSDVVIGDWSLPWNAKANAGRLAAGIPKSDYWASDPEGVDQIGCVYTAQGFEYDYAGVIFGRDLMYRPREGWVGQPDFSKDSIVRRAAKGGGAPFVELVKHTYRVLLTRGLLGCYVYFQDEGTRDFVLSRIERASERT
jgi:uncharacterized protein